MDQITEFLDEFQRETDRAAAVLAGPKLRERQPGARCRRCDCNGGGDVGSRAD